MRPLILLGSTGSIGTQTLDVIRRSNAPVRVEGLSARSSWETLLEQAREFQPRFVAVSDDHAAEQLRPHLSEQTELFVGEDASLRLTKEADYELAVNGMVGAAGLPISEAVLARGLDLALANKESLVIAGALLMDLAASTGGTILPVDSEHSAVAECLRGEDQGKIRRVLLTASGGPFRQTPAEEMESLTPEAALKHPNWEMGPRITIGSATLMNKALEVIELHHLFGLEAERIQVVVHPQSIVHSMVEFTDGSVKAQMGPPDMRVPILHALSHPDRGHAPYLRGFDMDAFSELSFEEPDLDRFPALKLGFRCVEEGEDSGCALNAADEVAVGAFLDGLIKFTDIARLNESALDSRPGLCSSIQDLRESDSKTRALAEELIRSSATC